MDHDATEPSSPSSTTEPTSTPRPRRRTPVVVAVVAAAALVVTGGGIGYAALSRVETTTTSSSASVGDQRLSRVDPRYGGQSGDQVGGFGGRLPQAPQGAGSPGSSGSSGSATGTDDTTGTASSDQLTGLVRIVSTMKYADGKAAGTGMVLTSDGEVVTNHHVVEGATSIMATVMSTGKTYTAEVVGTDAAKDVAVLKLEDASGLSTVTTDGDAVSTGDAVTAVGDGKGTVDHLSYATGSVIATGQSITTRSEGTASGESLSGLIEISSDVVGGYSGGATYDAEGEVLGMTTAASSGTSDIVGYAIPIATVLSIADDLENGVQSGGYAYGYPAFLGIGLAEGTSPTVAGVYDGTPADEAGITAGDTITRIGGTSVSTAAQLRAAIATHAAGDDVRVAWKDADGTTHIATVTLAQGPVK